MFRLNKTKIFVLYSHYLLNEDLDQEANDKVEPFYLSNVLEQEKYIKNKIQNKLNPSWKFARLPFLEQAVLVYAVYELLFGNYCQQPKLIIDQTINFSKAYLENNKYKYINKVLDLIIKQK